MNGAWPKLGVAVTTPEHGASQVGNWSIPVVMKKGKGSLTLMPKAPHPGTKAR